MLAVKPSGVTGRFVHSEPQLGNPLTIVGLPSYKVTVPEGCATARNVKGRVPVDAACTLPPVADMLLRALGVPTPAYAVCQVRSCELIVMLCGRTANRSSVHPISEAPPLVFVIRNRNSRYESAIVMLGTAPRLVKVTPVATLPRDDHVGLQPLVSIAPLLSL